MHHKHHHYKSREQPGKFKRYVLLAVVFLFFFAMSNYFMGSVAPETPQKSGTQILYKLINHKINK